MATQHQLAALQIQHQEHTDTLAVTKEELCQQHLASHFTNHDTPRSEDQTPDASGITAQANTSGLYSMVEGTLNPIEIQEQAISELQHGLAYIHRERDELQVNMERIIESPHKFDDKTLSHGDVSRTNTLPRAAVYHELTTNIPPKTSIMQYYHVLKGLNLRINRVPLLKPYTTLSKTQFEQIWKIADATARDTITFMWVT